MTCSNSACLAAIARQDNDCSVSFQRFPIGSCQVSLDRFLEHAQMAAKLFKRRLLVRQLDLDGILSGSLERVLHLDDHCGLIWRQLCARLDPDAVLIPFKEPAGCGGFQRFPGSPEIRSISLQGDRSRLRQTSLKKVIRAMTTLGQVANDQAGCERTVREKLLVEIEERGLRTSARFLGVDASNLEKEN
jgi:hypothetical protein